MLAMVGRAVKATNTAAVKAFSPLDNPNRRAVTGAKNNRPIKPKTTEGMLAIISTTGFRNSLTARGAISDKYTAVPKPKGSAMIKASADMINVPYTSDRVPQSGAWYEVGFQTAPNKNSPSLILPRIREALTAKKIKIPTNKTTDTPPVSLNKNRHILSKK